jgi:hypothetical protein
VYLINVEKSEFRWKTDDKHLCQNSIKQGNKFWVKVEPCNAVNERTVTTEITKKTSPK